VRRGAADGRDAGGTVTEAGLRNIRTVFNHLSKKTEGSDDTVDKDTLYGSAATAAPGARGAGRGLTRAVYRFLATRTPTSLSFFSLGGMLGERFFAVVDVNKDGEIGWDEFVVALASLLFPDQMGTRTQLLYNMFKLSPEHPGITPDELSIMLKACLLASNESIEDIEAEDAQEAGAAPGQGDGGPAAAGGFEGAPHSAPLLGSAVPSEGTTTDGDSNPSPALSGVLFEHRVDSTALNAFVDRLVDEAFAGRADPEGTGALDIAAFSKWIESHPFVLRAIYDHKVVREHGTRLLHERCLAKEVVPELRRRISVASGLRGSASMALTPVSAQLGSVDTSLASGSAPAIATGSAGASTGGADAHPAPGTPAVAVASGGSRPGSRRSSFSRPGSRRSSFSTSTPSGSPPGGIGTASSKAHSPAVAASPVPPTSDGASSSAEGRRPTSPPALHVPTPQRRALSFTRDASPHRLGSPRTRSPGPAAPATQRLALSTGMQSAAAGAAAGSSAGLEGLATPHPWDVATPIPGADGFNMRTLGEGFGDDAADDAPYLKEGVLHKYQQHMGNYIERYYAVRDGSLYYWKSKPERRDEPPLGVVYIARAYVEPFIGKAGGNPLSEGVYGIRFHTNSFQNEFELFAESAEEQSAWMEVLLKVCHLRRFEDVYTLGPQIGSGTYALVHQAFNRITGKEYAVKVINKASMTLEEKHNLQSEVATHLQCKHPNVAEVFDLFETPDRLLLVMEYLDGGELRKLLERGPLPEPVARKVIGQIVDGVEYLHEIGIVHRDLKPTNIGISGSGSSIQAKILDFGYSRYVNPSQKLVDIAGTRKYFAPELVRGEAYDMSVDVWCIGVLAYNILTGLYPFVGDTAEEVLRNIAHAHYAVTDDAWKSLSPEAKDFVRKLLKRDPAERPTIQELREHPWLRGETLPPIAVVGASALPARMTRTPSTVSSSTGGASHSSTDSLGLTRKPSSRPVVQQSQA